jgi:hypothetical protein
MKMPSARKLKPIGEMYCKQYKTDAQFFIEDDHPSGRRHLIVRYATGGHGGAPEFAAAIPAHWTDQDVINDFLLWPMKHPNAPYPTWEVPARAYGSPTLFRFWAGEKGE